MIKARASSSKVYLYFMKKGRQARHRIPRNSCLDNIAEWVGGGGEHYRDPLELIACTSIY